MDAMTWLIPIQHGDGTYRLGEATHRFAGFHVHRAIMYFLRQYRCIICPTPLHPWQSINVSLDMSSCMSVRGDEMNNSEHIDHVKLDDRNIP